MGCTWMQDVTVLGDSSVSCGGASSCMGIKGMTLVQKDTVILSCTADYSCAYAVAQDLIYASLLGWRAARLAEFLNAQQIHAYGAKAFYEGVLDSKGKDMLVLAYGDEAGLDAWLLCRTGSTCLLDCTTTGCKQLTYVC